MEATKPPCFDRPPRLPGYWRSGLNDVGEVVTVWVSSTWSEDACKTHSGQGIGPNGENYPAAHGWLDWCRQCRWMPAGMENAA